MNPLVHGSGSFISLVAIPVTVASLGVRNRIAAHLESEKEWLLKKRASAPVLGGRGRSQD